MPTRFFVTLRTSLERPLVLWLLLLSGVALFWPGLFDIDRLGDPFVSSRVILPYLIAITMLALSLFPDMPAAALPAALYTFGCMFTGTLLARIWSRDTSRDASHSASCQ